ncbi:hypothetical protein C3F09_05395 [candidate division GN15 bacterium]|uniref:asparagine synthase (glutamine-hydrolyzing) n=1 Tax=candidate division GN15 bacterium TaxID=2072418 RepID=A0A855X2K1_9BACT|nr:MAG: hypothetical protein C3F09_05395 [candidate division GN15 bacterium]
MPGILGIISRHHRAEGASDLARQFRAMADVLTHFGYYQLESLPHDEFCIGRIGVPCRGYRHVRRDDATGNLVAFDGFVYGWRGECRSDKPWAVEPVSLIPLEDTEQLEHLAASINGSFTLCLHDARDDRFFISTNRLGFRRLYYYEDNEVIAFAPEIKAFMALDGFRRELDLEGAADLFNYSFVIGNRTLYKHVRLLPAATTLIIQDRAIRKTKRYWWHTYTDQLDGDADHLAREMFDLSSRLLLRQTRDNSKLLMGLSGGMDSRYLAYLLKTAGRQATYSTYGSPRCDDVRIAGLVAAKLDLGSSFRQFEFDPLAYSKFGAWAAWLTDGMVDLIYPCHTLGVLQHFTENPVEYEYLNSVWSGRVNFTMTWGTAADIRTDLTFDQKLHRLSSMMGLQYLDDAYYFLLAPDFREEVRKLALPHIKHVLREAEPVGRNFLHQKDTFTLLTRTRRLHHQYDPYRYYFAEHFALVDDDIVEFRNRVPLNWVVDRRLYLKMYRDLVPEMAGIVYQKTGVNLFATPNYAAQRRHERMNRLRYLLGRVSLGRINLYDHHTFLHQDIWYRKYAKNRLFFEDILLDQRTSRRGFYDPPAIRRLLKNQAHGSSNYEVIAKLATFELFNRFFIDRESHPKAPYTLNG